MLVLNSLLIRYIHLNSTHRSFEMSRSLISKIMRDRHDNVADWKKRRSPIDDECPLLAMLSRATMTSVLAIARQRRLLQCRILRLLVEHDVALEEIQRDELSCFGLILAPFTMRCAGIRFREAASSKLFTQAKQIQLHLWDCSTILNFGFTAKLRTFSRWLSVTAAFQVKERHARFAILRRLTLVRHLLLQYCERRDRTSDFIRNFDETSQQRLAKLQRFFMAQQEIQRRELVIDGEATSRETLAFFGTQRCKTIGAVFEAIERHGFTRAEAVARRILWCDQIFLCIEMWSDIAIRFRDYFFQRFVVRNAATRIIQKSGRRLINRDCMSLRFGYLTRRISRDADSDARLVYRDWLTESWICLARALACEETTRRVSLCAEALLANAEQQRDSLRARWKKDHQYVKFVARTLIPAVICRQRLGVQLRAAKKYCTSALQLLCARERSQIVGKETNARECLFEIQHRVDEVRNEELTQRRRLCCDEETVFRAILCCALAAQNCILELQVCFLKELSGRAFLELEQFEAWGAQLLQRLNRADQQFVHAASLEEEEESVNRKVVDVDQYSIVGLPVWL